MEKNNAPLQIAIDGPVAAGKGDIAFRLAKELHLMFINTGVMYRMLALACILRGVSTKDKEKIIEVSRDIHIELAPSEKQPFIALLDGEDVTERITEPDTASGASDVSIIPEVRERMVAIQKNLAKGRRIVMEGRDIGLRVLPDAQLKIYLTASLEERARRRFLQWQEKGIKKPLTEITKEIELRDTQDMKRETDPLQKLPDAWELDTTNVTQDEAVAKIKQELIKRRLL